MALEDGARRRDRLLSPHARLLPGRVQRGAQLGKIETQCVHLLAQKRALFGGGAFGVFTTRELVTHLQQLGAHIQALQILHRVAVTTTARPAARRAAPPRCRGARRAPIQPVCDGSCLPRGAIRNRPQVYGMFFGEALAQALRQFAAVFVNERELVCGLPRRVRTVEVGKRETGDADDDDRASVRKMSPARSRQSSRRSFPRTTKRACIEGVPQSRTACP